MILKIWLSLLCISTMGLSAEGSSASTTTLVSKLLQAADVRVRPNADTSAATVIDVGLSLYSLTNVKSEDDYLTARIHIWPTFSWNDPRLSWDPESHNHITVISLPSTDIWIPDMTLFNKLEANRKIFHTSPVNVMISSDGNCTWKPPATLFAQCEGSLDAQNETVSGFVNGTECRFLIGSWLHDATEIDVHPKHSEITFEQNCHWIVMSSEIVRKEFYYACCKDPFPLLGVVLKVGRIIH